MITIHHINCGKLHAPPNPPASCHCLLLKENDKLALVDAGIGILDGEQPEKRFGQALIDAAGFLFDPKETAVAKIKMLGYDYRNVHNIIVSHLDPDHIGGLADFSDITVHVSLEEYNHFKSGHLRYLPHQLSSDMEIKTYSHSDLKWFDLEARKLEGGFESDIFLIPLFGHTLGHCGVAIQQGKKWLLYIGDAYYLRVETEMNDHPVSALAKARADDDDSRVKNLEEIKRLMRNHSNEIEFFGYHDFSEFR